MNKRSVVVVVGVLASSHIAWGGSLVSNSKRYQDRKPAATGRSGNATASVSALRDQQGNTTLTVQSGRLGVSAGSITKLQLKAFNAAENVAWTKNFNGLTGSTQHVNIGRFSRGQPIQTQAHIKGIDGNRTDIVTTSGIVGLLPDLSVLQVHAPDRAPTGQDVVITASIAERNGDAGALATCVLLIDGTERDRAAGIWVDAGGNVDCAFTHAFSLPGRVQVEVDVVAVDPADYDPSNNRAAATIIVNDPTSAAFNWDLEVASYRRDSMFDGGGWYAATDHSYGQDYQLTQTVHDDVQYVVLTGSAALLVKFPVAIRMIGIGDGQPIQDLALADLPFTYDYGDGDSIYQMLAYYDPATGTFAQVSATSFDGVASSYVQLARTSSHTTYFSRGYSHTWFNYHGEEYFYSFDGGGDFTSSPAWSMTSTFEGSWSVVDAAGHRLAAVASVSLQHSRDELHQPYTCTDYDYGDVLRSDCAKIDDVTDGWFGATGGITP